MRKWNRSLLAVLFDAVCLAVSAQASFFGRKLSTPSIRPLKERFGQPGFVRPGGGYLQRQVAREGSPAGIAGAVSFP